MKLDQLSKAKQEIFIAVVAGAFALVDAIAAIKTFPSRPALGLFLTGIGLVCLAACGGGLRAGVAKAVRAGRSKTHTIN